MKRVIVASAAVVAGVILLAPHPSRAQGSREEIEAVVKDYVATHPEELGKLVKDYMIRHPEAVGEILTELLKHRSATNASGNVGGNAKIDHSAAVASNAAALFSSPHQVMLGNVDGDVTLVEFFDYNCGYCKRALADLLKLIDTDAKLKIVLKEFPILGPGSVEAARIAVAVRMQDQAKYLPFHLQLLGGAGPASKDKAIAAAGEQGLDTARLQRDAASEEVRVTLDEDMKLAAALGITGTPGYVVGNDVILGAVGSAALKLRVDSARMNKAN